MTRHSCVESNTLGNEKKALCARELISDDRMRIRFCCGQKVTRVMRQCGVVRQNAHPASFPSRTTHNDFTRHVRKIPVLRRGVASAGIAGELHDVPALVRLAALVNSKGPQQRSAGAGGTSYSAEGSTVALVRSGGGLGFAGDTATKKKRKAFGHLKRAADFDDPVNEWVYYDRLCGVLADQYPKSAFHFLIFPRDSQYKCLNNVHGPKGVELVQHLGAVAKRLIHLCVNVAPPELIASAFGAARPAARHINGRLCAVDCLPGTSPESPLTRLIRRPWRVGFQAMPSMPMLALEAISPDFSGRSMTNSRRFNRATTDFLLPPDAVVADLKAHGRVTLNQRIDELRAMEFGWDADDAAEMAALSQAQQQRDGAVALQRQRAGPSDMHAKRVRCVWCNAAFSGAALPDCLAHMATCPAGDEAAAGPGSPFVAPPLAPSQVEA